MKGKVIVLTGASGGIGAALAHELAQAGAKLILVGRNEQALSELSTELGDGHTVLAADISTADGRDAILSHCNGLESGVDILLNNAGISGFVSFDKMDEDKIMSLININLTSTILLTQGMLPILSKKPASKIIVIGSAFGGICLKNRLQKLLLLGRLLEGSLFLGLRYTVRVSLVFVVLRKHFLVSLPTAVLMCVTLLQEQPKRPLMIKMLMR